MFAKNKMLSLLTILIASTSVLVRVYFVLAVNYIWEDALITLRYVFNLIEGNGFVYNVGERVLGTTTPGYTLTLVSLGIIGVPPLIAA